MSRWQLFFKHGRALSTRAKQNRYEQNQSGSSGSSGAVPVAVGVSAAVLGYKVLTEEDR